MKHEGRGTRLPSHFPAIAVFAAAGDTAFTSTPFVASSFASDFVSAINPAFEAL